MKTLKKTLTLACMVLLGMSFGCQVMVRIFNTLGQEIRMLTDIHYEAGFHSVHWDAKNNNGNVVSSGIYLYQLQAGSFSEIRKMTLLR